MRRGMYVHTYVCIWVWAIILYFGYLKSQDSSGKYRKYQKYIIVLHSKGKLRSVDVPIDSYGAPHFVVRPFLHQYNTTSPYYIVHIDYRIDVLLLCSMFFWKLLLQYKNPVKMRM